MDTHTGPVRSVTHFTSIAPANQAVVDNNSVGRPTERGEAIMENRETELEVLDEGVEECEMVCGCCAGGVSSARK
jgi:putative radical SAM-modified peptide